MLPERLHIVLIKSFMKLQPIKRDRKLKELQRVIGGSNRETRNKVAICLHKSRKSKAVGGLLEMT